MPRATVSQEVVHKELKTLEGGFVDLKQLSFDQILERRDKAMRMSMEQVDDKKKSKNEKTMVQFESAMQWARFFEFSNCIVEHNLEDDNGKPLNFNNPMTMKILDPKIGSEIEKYIEEMNMEDDDESLEDFMNAASSSSLNDTTKPNESTEPS